jgi:hypothetical protein
MPRSRSDLIDQVLDNLGVLVPGQAPGDEAKSRVDRILDPALAQLAATGDLFVADPGLANPPTGGDYEDASFLPLATWVTGQCAPAFNLAGDPSFKVLADQALEILRVIGRPASTRRVLHTDGQLRGTRTRSPVGNFSRGT